MIDSQVIHVLLVVLDAQYLKAYPGKAGLIRTASFWLKRLTDASKGRAFSG